MRDSRTIELEIDVARQDLQTSLTELKDVVLDKLDVKKRAKEAVAERKQQAKYLARGAQLHLFALVQRLRISARERPEIALIATVGFLVLGAMIVRHRTGGVR